jgi:hypothetical protein
MLAPTEKSVQRDLHFLKQLQVVIYGDFYLAQDIPNQRTSEVIAGMIRNRCAAAVGMAKDDVTALLSNLRKSKLCENMRESAKINDRQSCHTVTSICCKPTKRGCS